MAVNVTLVGTYPPTACGLATYTSNVRLAISAPEHGWSARAVRVVDRPEPLPGGEVTGQWVKADPGSLLDTAGVLNASDVAVLEHEYGLYAGADGEEVVDLAERLAVPIVLDTHTALRSPTPNQRRVLGRLIELASVTVVHSEAARRILAAVHDIDPADLVVIQHGAAANFSGSVQPDVPRPAVLTWGLVGPGKGIEHGIAAIAGIRADARPTYIVAGRTHPKVLALDGDRYRDGLRATAHRLGAADRVVFDDTYRSWPSLRELVRSADVVLLPYDSTEQVCSGVLVEALASAKPVVATRFPHAEELLGGGAGILVDNGDVDAIRAAVARVLYEPGVAATLATAARETALHQLLWPTVGAAYRDAVVAAMRQTARL